MTLFEHLRNYIKTPRPLPPGLHAYERRDGAGGRVRLHLRVEPDGRGILLINAAQVLHLNPTAAEYTRLILEEVPEPEAVRTMTRRYRVEAASVRSDLDRMRGQIEALIHPEEAMCPIHGLNLERIDPFSMSLSAPYRMDLALTYRCNNG